MQVSDHLLNQASQWQPLTNSRQTSVSPIEFGISKDLLWKSSRISVHSFTRNFEIFLCDVQLLFLPRFLLQSITYERLKTNSEI